MDEDAARLEKDGVEADLQVALADAPAFCGEGFRLVRREWPTDIGPVDLMCRDEEDGWIAVEIKRIGTIDAVEQLSRYLERIRLDPAMADCRGVLAAHDRQAAGARAGRGARAGVGRGRPGGAARAARAGADPVRRMSEAVLTEASGGVLLITLNRPDQRNAVNAAVAEGVAAALERLDGDDELRVAILTGAGKGFCAGMDLKAFVTGERPFVEGRGFAGIVQAPPRKPIIAAIEGFAVAGGFEVALACDLIVAARGARLGIPEVKRSLVAAGGALLHLPRRMPYHVAMELALTGDPIERRARLRARDRQPARRARRRRRRRARAGGRDRRQRPAGDRRHEADHARPAGLAAGRGVGPPARDLRARVRLGGRARGRDGLRRAPRPGLEGPLGGLRAVARAASRAASASPPWSRCSHR